MDISFFMTEIIVLFTVVGLAIFPLSVKTLSSIWAKK